MPPKVFVQQKFDVLYDRSKIEVDAEKHRIERLRRQFERRAIEATSSFAYQSSFRSSAQRVPLQELSLNRDRAEERAELWQKFVTLPAAESRKQPEKEDRLARLLYEQNAGLAMASPLRLVNEQSAGLAMASPLRRRKEQQRPTYSAARSVSPARKPMMIRPPMRLGNSPRRRVAVDHAVDASIQWRPTLVIAYVVTSVAIVLVAIVLYSFVGN